MTGAPARSAPDSGLIGLARKAGLETLSLRIAELTPALMTFGPGAALIGLLTASLAALRGSPAG